VAPTASGADTEHAINTVELGRVLALALAEQAKK